MAAPIVGNYAVALAEEIKQLCVPVICAQWPTVMKDERLCVFRAPILVENIHSIGGSYVVNGFAPFEGPRRTRPCSITSKVQIQTLGEVLRLANIMGR
jgi:hypothetical protein